MTTSKLNTKGLLPAGFKDMLPASAEFESALTASVLAHTAGFGYLQVSPPVIEFETTLLTTKDDRLKHQTFRMMDPLSRQMMALRADMTMQVARIALSRLSEEPRPLRLCYTGNVFRVQGEGLYTERQLRQVGAELIGSKSSSADAEVVMIAATALESIGFKNLTVDFSLPGLAPAILAASSLSKTARKNLLDKIERKDVAAIRQLADTPTAALLEKTMRAAGDADTCLKALEKLSLPAAAKAMVKQLGEVIKRLKKTLPKTTLTIDPLERRGFEYHTGSTFSFFSAESGEELGRGGRYAIGPAESPEEAVGFSLIINTLQRNLKAPAPKKRVLVAADAPVKTITGLQAKGYAAVLDSEETGLSKKEAKRLGCGFVSSGGKLTKI